MLQSGFKIMQNQIMNTHFHKEIEIQNHTIRLFVQKVLFNRQCWAGPTDRLQIEVNQVYNDVSGD